MDAPLLINLSHRAHSLDLDIRTDGPASVGDVVDEVVNQASLVGVPHRPSLAVSRTGQTLPRELRLVDADIRSGDRCWLNDAPPPGVSTGWTAAAEAEIVEGHDAGQIFALRPGANDVGRAELCEISIDDELVSRRHARIVVSDEIRIHDLGSTNGVLVNGRVISQATRIDSDDLVTIGDTVLRLRISEDADEVPVGSTVPFNRPPHVFRPYQGANIKIAAPPGDPPKNRFSITSAIVPLVMVLGMFLYYESQPDQEFPMIFLAFMLMSPVMVIGSYYENRGWNRRDHKEQLSRHMQHVEKKIAELEEARVEEVESRAREYPSADETVEFLSNMSPRMWERHPDETEFLALRIGRAEQPSRSEAMVESGGSHRLRAELEEIPARYATIPELPATANLRDVGGLGLAGPVDDVNALARAVIVQLAGLHSPGEVVLAGLFGEQEAREWEWLGWLPHIRSSVSPFVGSQFGVGVSSCLTLLNDLISVLEERLAAREDQRDGGPAEPAVVVFIDESAPIDRTRLLTLFESGPAVGVFFIWMASARTRLPRACGAVVDVQVDGDGSVLGLRTVGEEIDSVSLEPLSKSDALEFARGIAPVSEIGGRIGLAASVPERVQLVDLLGGVAVLDDCETIIDRWRQGDELLEQGKQLRLRAPIGRQADSPLSIDIRTDGPHALVAGTTGSGKSELLQSYVASLAATHSANHVTFLLVDYKGGAAFKDCVDLPHAVGLVTDLNTSEVRRALISLEAELKHRERILNEAGAKDLIELEGMQYGNAPPTLLLIVDEFAALAKEVPEFIEGIVDVALRGRSLGIHLILATQRPAGVITPQIRANTSLRIALRVADDDDSVDVVGTKDAAVLPANVPGRAFAKLGPRDSTLFQSAYVGGFTHAAASGPMIAVSRFAFDERRQLGEAESDERPFVAEDATDLQRLVANVRMAHAREGTESPRRPWQPPLANVYDLARLPQSETDADIVLGVVDMPSQQRQEIAHFRPDQAGSLLILGSSGSGKTVLLRTLAAAAGLTKSGASTHVYGLDFAGRGLEMLNDLPHVGAIVHGHDNERVVRLLRDLRTRIDERSERFAAVRASSLPEFRASSRDAAAEPRLLVLLDGYAAFNSVYERIEGGKWVDWLTQLVADGRQFGVHFAMTADRRSAFPLALTSAVGGRIVLRLANQDEYAAAGVPVELAAAATTAGRAVLDDLETQIALLGGDESGDAQTTAMSGLAESLKGRLHREPTPVRILPEELRLESVPRSDGGFTLGMRDADLGPAMLPFTLGGAVVAGPPQSGKSTALRTLVSAAPPQVSETVIVGYHETAVTQPAPRRRVGVGEVDGARLLREVLDSEERDLLVVIDDLHEFAHTEVDMIVTDILRKARAQRWMVLASASADAMRRAYDGALRDVRANKTGILLQPDSEVDGDIVGLRLPRAVNVVWPAGRGYLVHSGAYELCQVAMPQ